MLGMKGRNKFIPQTTDWRRTRSSQKELSRLTANYAKIPTLESNYREKRSPTK